MGVKIRKGSEWVNVAGGGGTLSDIKQWANADHDVERTCSEPIFITGGDTIGIGSTSNAYGNKYVQDTEPSSSCDGDLWYDTSDSSGDGNPVGTVIWYAGSTAPTGYLKSNGDAIANGSGTTQSITADFSALYAIVGANLPDLRGEFVRGFDDGKGTDSGRAIRSSQTDSYEEHSHIFCQDQQVGDEAFYTDLEGVSHDYERVGNSYDTDADSQGIGPASYNYRTLTDDRQTNTPGTETRPRNIALLACIKY